jgi:hypothetical protein
MKILIEHKDLKEAMKLGFKPRVPTLNHDLMDYVVEIPTLNALTYLRNRKAEMEASVKSVINSDLFNKRIDNADKKFEQYNFKKEGVEIVDSDGWENDGRDRLIKQIFYEPINETVDQSTSGSFIVDFKAGSVKVIDVHANL